MHSLDETKKLEQLKKLMPEVFSSKGKLSLLLLEKSIGKENIDLNNNSEGVSPVCLNEDLLITLINATPDFICFKDGQNRWQIANQAAVDLFSLSDIDYIGRTNAELANLSDPSYAGAYHFCEQTDEHAWANKVFSLIEEVIPKSDGSFATYEVIKMPVFTADNERKGLVILGRDITGRKQAEVLLKESHLQLEKMVKERTAELEHVSQLNKAIIENAGNAIFSTDRYGIFLAFNPYAEELTGLRAKDVIGHSLSVDHFRETLFGDLQNEAALSDKTRIRYFLTIVNRLRETVIVKKNGAKIPVLLSVSVLRNSAGRIDGFVGVATDISKIKKAEEALRMSQKELILRDSYLTAIVDNYPGLFWMKDVKGEFLFSNRLNNLFVRLTTRNDCASIIGKKYTDFCTAMQAQVYQRADKKVITRKKAITHEEMITIGAKDSWYEHTRFPILGPDGLIIGIAGYSIDITERKNREAQLRMQSEAFESFALGVVITDRHSLIQWVNPAFENLTGYTAKEIIGKSAAILKSNLQTTEFTAQLWQTITSGQIWHGEFINKRKDGALYYEEATITPVKNDLGEIAHYIALKVDVSHRKQLEESLRRNMEKEKELNEMKSRFVATASHEFRTPLASILLSNDSLINYWEKMDTPLIKSKLIKIRSSVLHLSNIVTDILQLSKIRDGKVEFNPQKLDIVALSKEIIDLFKEGEYSSPIIFDCEYSSLPLLVDGRLMRQALNNLISNALKYSRGGLPVHVEIKCRDEVITISVTDSGIGIPEADQKHLFTPFFRASNSKLIPGNGLGLNIMRESIIMHGGEVSFTSKENEGSTFVLHLPVLYELP